MNHRHPITAAMAALILAACSSQPPVTQTEEQCQFPTTGDDAPRWLCPPHIDDMPDMAWAVGSFPASPASYAFREEFAVHNAKLKLLARVEEEIAALRSDYERTTGGGQQQTLDAVSERVSQSLRNGSVRGAQIYRITQDEAGNLWVLVGTTTDELMRMRDELTLSSYRNASAEHQIAAADEGLAKLQQALDQRGQGQLAESEPLALDPQLLPEPQPLPQP